MECKNDMLTRTEYGVVKRSRTNSEAYKNTSLWVLIFSNHIKWCMSENQLGPARESKILSPGSSSWSFSK